MWSGKCQSCLSESGYQYTNNQLFLDFTEGQKILSGLVGHFRFM